ENFLGEIGTCHGCSPLAFGRRIAVAHARCWTRPGRDGAGMSGTTGPRTCPASAESSGAGRAAATCGAPGRTTGTRRRAELLPLLSSAQLPPRLARKALLGSGPAL